MSERAYWLAWSRIPKLGPVTLQKLCRHFGSLEAAWAAEAIALAEVSGVGPGLIAQIEQVRPRLDPDRLLDEHWQANPLFWTPADSDYPAILRQISSPPAVLYYDGIVDPTETLGDPAAIAIVGTREPSEYGRRWARQLAKGLAARGFCIISGLADGIDAEAHWGALEVGGRTLAVLGNGVKVVYPSQNASLYEAIRVKGLLLSEYPAHTAPDRLHFPQRNRIVAALAQAVIVIEAGERSGALITAELAQKFRRPIFVLPGSLDNPKAKGCLALIQRGAQLFLDEASLLEQLAGAAIAPPMTRSSAPRQLSLSDVPSTPAIAPQPIEKPRAQIPPDLAEDLQLVLGAIAAEPRSFDQVVQHLQGTMLAAPLISSALLQLELEGLIVQLPGLLYQRLCEKS